MKKLTIIGAGIAGLSSGIYAQKRGFQCTIHEQHTIPGGNSTSWKRKGYLFEGGLHWLTGSKEDSPLYKEWCEVGAINPSTVIHYREAFVSCVYGQQVISFYTDPVRLRDHLLEISPADKKAIKKFYKHIKRFSHIEMPVFDVPGVKLKEKQPMPSLLMLLYLKMAAPFEKITAAKYASSFRHPAIRLMLEELAGADNRASNMLTLLASVCSGDGGYPEGGSSQMAKRMAKYFEELGGTIHYGHKVEQIEVKDKKAISIRVHGTQVPLDNLIVTTDTRSAIDTLFHKPLDELWCHRMREDIKPVMCTFVSLGIKRDWRHLPTNFVVPLQSPLLLDQFQYNSLFLNNYASYSDYSTEGCSTVTCILFGDSYNYWKIAKEDGTYQEKKASLGKLFVQSLNEQFAFKEDEIEVIDIATPLTFERYCSTYHGSWMSVDQIGKKSEVYPIKPASISNLYFCGQRIMPPGGTPVALVTARQAVQQLCKDHDLVF